MNAKFLRAFQCMLIPTQGKGVGNRSFFEADFGKDEKEFVKFLCMPDKLIAARGDFSIRGKGRKDESEDQVIIRKNKWDQNQLKIEEWNRLFDQLLDERDEFIDKISDNKYLPEKLFGLRTTLQKKLYMHYLTEPRILALLGKLKNGSPTRELIKHYLTIDFPIMYKSLVSLLVSTETQQQYMFINFISCFGHEGLHSIIQALEQTDYDADKQMSTWSKICKKSNISYIDFELLRIYRRYVELSILPKNDHHLAQIAIRNESMQDLGAILQKHLPTFHDRLSKNLEGEKGQQILLRATELIFQSIQTKLTDIIKEGI